MKQPATFNQIFVSIIILSSIFFGAPHLVYGQSSTTSRGQCSDGIDNQIGDGKDYGLGVGKGDGKADYGGVYEQDGTMKYEPDPSCFSPTATKEVGDDVAKGSLVPCTDKCTFSDVFKLLNNILTFFIKTLLIPLFIIMIMYAGFKYIKAGASGSGKADLKKMFGNMILGIVLILCSWLIVHTILVALGYTEGLMFFD